MKKFILLILFCYAISVFSQVEVSHITGKKNETKLDPIVAKRIKKYYGKEAVEKYNSFTIKEKEDKITPVITKRVKKRYGKKSAKEYHNFLFIHSLDVEKSDFEKIADESNPDSIVRSLVKDLNVSTQPYFWAIIYNDSLKVLALDCYGHYICQASREDELLLKYCLDHKADLVFIVLNYDLKFFALIDNKIYWLDYDRKTKKLSVSDQW